MNFSFLDGIGWLLLTLGPLLIFQSWLHQEIQALLLILTRRPSVAVALFSILFFPGVTLHELSHFLAARLLDVPTGRISLIPKQMKNGRLRLGFVETAPTDFFRDALIGTAPLFSGGAVMAYIGIIRMGLIPIGNSLLTGQFSLFWQEFSALPLLPDFWLWLYLAFVVSSTMLPSSSDRKAWLPILEVFGILLILGLFFGIGPWLVANVAPVFNQVMRSIAVIFAISLAVHVAILLPTWLLRLLICRMTGLTLKR
jgi:hypothetical protein